MRSLRILLLIVMGVLAVACAGEGEAGTTTAPATSTTVASTTTTSTAATTTTSAPAPTTTTAPPTSTTASGELPGEPIAFGPAAGDTLAVIGVAHDDVLNLRAAPGADQPIVGEIPPTYETLTAVGETRELPGSFWISVAYEGTAGWVNLRYVGYLGDTTDQTSAIIGDVDGAETMLDLGYLVARTLASEEPPSEIVLVVAPTVGDLGEVTYDVIGLGDDAQRGWRVHVFGTPITEAFALRTVEVTALCGRGVDNGACV
jgi:hypothetical protein